MARKGRQKRWSYIAGEKGRNRVRAFELEGGRLHIEFMEHGRRRTLALGHRDRGSAKEKADQVAAGLGDGVQARERGDLTLSELFDNYLREVTPGKGVQQQASDRRAVGLWLQVVPRDRLASGLTSQDAEAFIAQRKAWGDLRPGRKGILTGKQIRPRAWKIDLSFLKAVLRWGRAGGVSSSDPGILHHRDRSKAEIRRPSLSRSDAVRFREAAREVGMACFCLFLLTHETGHRVGAVRQLRWLDVDLENASVRWRPELDKIKFDHTTPLSRDALEALRLMRDHARAIGDSPIFEAPKGPGQPISRNLVRDWWERMEDIVNLPGRERRGWHSLRRKFASDLKNSPLSDLAQLGGWTGTATILRSYMQPDQETMRTALANRPGILSGATTEGTAEAPTRDKKNQQPRIALTQSGAVS